MKQGFFVRSELPTLSNNESLLVPKCGACGLWKSCKSPKLEPVGKGRKKVLIIAEAPGADEDKEGRQAVGNSWQDLERRFMRLGFDMRKDAVLTSALICRPPDQKIKNPASVSYCRPNLIKTIKALNPEIIIPLGGTAIESLIKWTWGQEPGAVSRWIGYCIPDRKLNAWIVPNFHPSYLLHDGNNKVAELLFTRALEKGLSKVGKGRPHDKNRTKKPDIELIFNVDEALEAIHQIKKNGGVFAFDYECLVPNTKVLTDNFKWVKIGSLKVGDSLTAFEENGRPGSWKKILKAKVTAVKRFTAPCIRITLTDGRKVEASENHPWLASVGPRRVAKWTKTSDLKPGHLIRQMTTKTWKTDKTHSAGWLAGFFDGEGYITGKVMVGVAQVFGKLFDKTMKLLKQKGFKFGSSEKIWNGHPERQRQMMAYCQGLAESLRFVGTIRPSRLIRNLKKNVFGKTSLPKVAAFATIKSVKYIGKREVVGVTTDTGTYVAEGLCSHNTNMLKPHSKESEIVCCSISNGERTIVFPWTDRIARYMLTFFLDKGCKKIASNMLMEDGWSRIFGCAPKGWFLDTMLHAHVMENSNKVRNISGLKFQAYVHLGYPDWSSHLEKYLRTKDKGGYSKNQVRQADKRQLYYYCGLDSLYEYQLARHQCRISGKDWPDG